MHNNAIVMDLVCYHDSQRLLFVVNDVSLWIILFNLILSLHSALVLIDFSLPLSCTIVVPLLEGPPSFNDGRFPDVVEFVLVWWVLLFPWILFIPCHFANFVELSPVLRSRAVIDSLRHVPRGYNNNGRLHRSPRDMPKIRCMRQLLCFSWRRHCLALLQHICERLLHIRTLVPPARVQTRGGPLCG